MADYLVQACSPMFNLPVSNMLCVSSESGHVLELELLVLFKLQSIDGTALQLMAVHFWASWPLSLNTKQTCRSWFLDSWRAWPGEEQERERERSLRESTWFYLYSTPGLAGSWIQHMVGLQDTTGCYRCWWLFADVHDVLQNILQSLALPPWGPWTYWHCLLRGSKSIP